MFQARQCSQSGEAPLTTEGSGYRIGKHRAAGLNPAIGGSKQRSGSTLPATVSGSEAASPADLTADGRCEKVVLRLTPEGRSPVDSDWTPRVERLRGSTPGAFGIFTPSRSLICARERPT